MKKIGLLMLALVLALSSLGIAYAMWSDTVTINGTVDTGSIKIGIADMGTADTGADPAYSPGHNTEGKDVASHSSANNGDVKCTIASQNFYGSVTEVISNAYPYYASGSTLKIANGGSVPLIIESVAMTTSDPGISGKTYNSNLLKWMVYSSYVIDDNGTPVTPLGDTLETVVTGYLLEPEHVLTLDSDFYFAETISELGLLPMDSAVSYTITVTGVQWNGHTP